MPSYDLVYILRPDLEAEAVTAVIGRATQRLTDQGAAIEHTEPWGKRRMAFSMGRYREGYYMFTRFSVSGDRIPEIRHGLKIMEDVLRASITIAVGPIQQKPSPAAPADAAASSVAATPAPTPVPADSTDAPSESTPTPTAAEGAQG